MAVHLPLIINNGSLAQMGSDDTVPQSAIPAGIPLSKIAQSGASSGQVATWSGTEWVPSTPSGSGGGGVFPAIEQPENVRTADFTAQAGKIHLVDVSSATITVTPPSSPSANDSFGVCDATGAITAAKRIVVSFGSQLFCGQTNVDYELVLNSSCAVFLYAGSTTGWICVTRG